ncbi:MATE family efflux transporter [Acidaminobacter sp. JC074]|uniref:MATE family efflux transporter n=1 Tax=Acidaminobacter sp. JC074 TaxID=2530199 RepID=UPI001F0E5F3A|nr:MATE family efflux transporter [Acidaminobacter sp. JC074]MCH4886000.1 MATE family efflux transporter [Acidaminobacter sp. JC074]
MNKNLENESIWKLILRFSVPSMIAILVSTFYNIVDRIFIGQFVGPDALAGLTIVYPVMLVIFAGSALIGRGGANLISINLGKNDVPQTQKVFTTTVVTTVIFSSIMSLVGYISLGPILSLLGASDSVFTFGYDYMSYILIGVICWIMSFTLSCTVRAEGRAPLSMIAMVVSAGTNILLDYIFIVQMHMGVRGAAIATIIAQAVGFFILAAYYLLSSEVVKLNKAYIRPELKVVRKLLTVGLPSYFVTVGSGISLMVLNRYLGDFGGVGAVASIGAIGSLMAFFNIPVFGIQNGIQPIIGYNYGAGNLNRVRKTVLLSMVITFATGSIIFVLIRYQASNLISLFLDGQVDYLLQGANGLKVYSLLIPLTGIINISIAYLQSIEEPLYATAISLSKQILVLIPAVMIFSSYWGIQGVWYAVPFSDMISITLAISLIFMQNLRSRNMKQIYT